jgi:hypothetical protein
MDGPQDLLRREGFLAAASPCRLLTQRDPVFFLYKFGLNTFAVCRPFSRENSER